MKLSTAHQPSSRWRMRSVLRKAVEAARSAPACAFVLASCCHGFVLAQTLPDAPSVSAIEGCAALAGTYSARGVDVADGGRVFYYEVVGHRRANAAETIVITFDTTNNRLVLRQLRRDATDAVPAARITGTCEDGTWIHRFDGMLPGGDGGHFHQSAVGTIAKRDGKLLVTFRKRETVGWLSKRVYDHERAGVFPPE